MIQLDFKQKVIILTLVGALLFGGGYRLAQFKERAPQPAPVLEQPGSAVVAPPKEILVHVAGAVEKPGVHRLWQGARVIDAVSAAGPLPGASLDSLRLAAPVSDGQTVIVPDKSAVSATSSLKTGAGVQGTAASTAGSQAGGGALVNINTAGPEELDTLPGIGPALAQRIIQYRETHGPFQTVEDLKKVSGIGEKSFEKLKDKITVY